MHGRAAADEALALIARHRATMFEGVPAMYAMLLASPVLAEADLTSLRVCTVGGQTISNATISAWQEASAAPLIEGRDPGRATRRSRRAHGPRPHRHDGLLR